MVVPEAGYDTVVKSLDNIAFPDDDEEEEEDEDP